MAKSKIVQVSLLSLRMLNLTMRRALRSSTSIGHLWGTTIRTHLLPIRSLKNSRIGFLELSSEVGLFGLVATSNLFTSKKPSQLDSPFHRTSSSLYEYEKDVEANASFA